jgi:hypothetical protein
MALDFGMLQPVNISGQLMAGQQQAQQNQLAQQQLLANKQQMQTGALTQENLQMQIEQAKRERDALAKLQESFIANGKSGDLNNNFDEMIKSGIPHFVDIGIKGKQALDRQNRVASILGGSTPTPTQVPMPIQTPGTLGSGTFDPNAAPITNALSAPIPYKPVIPRNALTAPLAAPMATPTPSATNEIENTYRKIDQLHAIGEHDLAKSLEQRVKDKLPPTIVQEYYFSKTPEGGNFKGSFEQFKTLQAPKTTVNVPVNVSTEKKYGEAFAGKMADRDIAMLESASKAPDLAANANRVLNVLNRGDVFTGSAADIKLNLARVLNVAGADNDSKIANTEMLVSGLAKNTLGAVKASGLGSGQGFTDKDLEFLQNAEGGRITLNAQTIRQLAELSHKAAEASATAWNSRVKQIPGSAAQGTGLSVEPIKVPPRLNAASSGPKVGLVQDGYRFKGGDPAVQSNWEKL